MMWALATRSGGTARWHVVDTASWLPTALIKRCNRDITLRAERCPVQHTTGHSDPPEGVLCAQCVALAGRQP
jgi:hypothetical protein